jgi:helix-turn-helix protein
MNAPEPDSRRILVPYNSKEGLSIEEAAEFAGKSYSTIRNWCVQHGIGRRIGGGVWAVSRPALLMFLEDDKRALRAYHAGDRTSELVTAYFERCRPGVQR